MSKKKLFSLRYGYCVPNKIQSGDLEQGSINRLWNALESYYTHFLSWASKSRDFFTNLFDVVFSQIIEQKYKIVWYIDDLRKEMPRIGWLQVLDLLDYTSNNYPVLTGSPYLQDSNAFTKESFIKKINTVLEEESTAYRFVNGQITEIQSEVEIKEIEAAINTPGIKPGVSEHLRNALERFSDRTSPDYPNTIKESISAVEALCKVISGDEKATLGDALKKIQKDGKTELHPTLKTAFDKLFGYTSDAGGIRHGSFELSNVTIEDARFFLVSCSAFINYLKVKADKAGIVLN